MSDITKPRRAQPEGAPRRQRPERQRPAGAQQADMTREQFIQRAADAAGKRFDQIDRDGKGVVTRQQVRAWVREQQRTARRATDAGAAEE